MGVCACNEPFEDDSEQNVIAVRDNGLGGTGKEELGYAPAPGLPSYRQHSAPGQSSYPSDLRGLSTPYPVKVSSGGIGFNVPENQLVSAALQTEKAVAADVKEDAGRKEEPKLTDLKLEELKKDDLKGSELGPLYGSSEGSCTSQEASARHQAYLKRKKERAEKKKKSAVKESLIGGPSTLLKDGFLSNVPEVEADVQYRFIFAVYGKYASRVIEAACHSPAASALPHAAHTHDEYASEGADSIQSLEDEQTLVISEDARYVSPGTRVENDGEDQVPDLLVKQATPEKKKPGAHRCLCPVPFPWGRTNSTARLKLAKLVFSPVTRAKDIPECTSKLEALSCALIFLLVLDPLDDGMVQPFQKQLQDIADILDDMRFRIRPEFRQTKAFILCRMSEEADTFDDSYHGALEDFESDYGAIWKFGPISIRDGDQFHTAFAKIASQRILKQQNSDEDSDVSVDRPMPVYETENDQVANLWEEPPPAQQSFLNRVSGGARSLLGQNKG